MSQLPPETRSAFDCQCLADAMRAKLQIFTPRELAAKLGISIESVLSACKRGELKHTRVNARVFKIESQQAARWWIGLSK